MIRCTFGLKRKEGCIFLSKIGYTLRTVPQSRMILESQRLSRRLPLLLWSMVKNTKRSYSFFQSQQKNCRVYDKNMSFRFLNDSTIPTAWCWATLATVLGIGTYLSTSNLMIDEKKSSNVKTNNGTKCCHKQSYLYSPLEPQKIMQFINSYPLILWGICGTNFIVFSLWRIPKLNRLMTKHFMNSLYDLRRGRFHTLLTACFSHQSGVHFLFNTMCLTSIAPTWVHILGSANFLKFYIGAGVISSMTWCTWQGINALIFRVILRRSSSAVNTLIYSGSVGASGAICGVLALHALAFPNTLFQLIFFPFYSFTAENCLKGLVIFDICGLIWSVIGTSPLGHAAHLGGVGVGYVYYEYHLRHQNSYLRQRRQRYW